MTPPSPRANHAAARHAVKLLLPTARRRTPAGARPRRPAWNSEAGLTVPLCFHLNRPWTRVMPGSGGTRRRFLQARREGLARLRPVDDRARSRERAVLDRRAGIEIAGARAVRPP